MRNTGHKSSYHLYMLRVTKATEEQRDAIITAIAEREVSVNVHFIPLPMLSFYKEARDTGWWTTRTPTDSTAREISLPVYYDLTDAQVDDRDQGRKGCGGRSDALAA
jgi:dTDP-4-amino-4,6-dideoxygalactose transaminase